jgi:hypothetical protein
MHAACSVESLCNAAAENVQNPSANQLMRKTHKRLYDSADAAAAVSPTSFDTANGCVTCERLHWKQCVRFKLIVMCIRNRQWRRTGYCGYDRMRHGGRCKDSNKKYWHCNTLNEERVGDVCMLHEHTTREQRSRSV